MLLRAQESHRGDQKGVAASTDWNMIAWLVAGVFARVLAGAKSMNDPDLGRYYVVRVPHEQGPEAYVICKPVALAKAGMDLAPGLEDDVGGVVGYLRNKFTTLTTLDALSLEEALHDGAGGLVTFGNIHH